MTIWERKCPQCEKISIYTRKNRWEKACVKNAICSDCKKARIWTRQCPECEKELTYKQKAHRNKLAKSDACCMSCAKKKCVKNKNPFYGKKHLEETKIKISNYIKCNPVIKSQSLLDSISNSMKGSKNPMFGKSIYDIWLNKYGKAEADKKIILLNEKRKINATGEKNPMYGKPSPQGSGNGWSGWYKNVFFRSLHELSYIVMVLEKEKKKWKSAEFIKIPYKNWDDKWKTYHPDFLVNEIEIVEIKPTRLQTSTGVKLKCDAARKYCTERNMNFSIIDPQILSHDEIKQLYKTKKIKFIKRYEDKFKNYD